MEIHIVVSKLEAKIGKEARQGHRAAAWSQVSASPLVPKALRPDTTPVLRNLLSPTAEVCVISECKEQQELQSLSKQQMIPEIIPALAPLRHPQSQSCCLSRAMLRSSAHAASTGFPMHLILAAAARPRHSGAAPKLKPC